MNDFHGCKGGAGNWILWGVFLFIPACLFDGIAGGIVVVLLFGGLAIASEKKYRNTECYKKLLEQQEFERNFKLQKREEKEVTFEEMFEEELKKIREMKEL